MTRTIGNNNVIASLKSQRVNVKNYGWREAKDPLIDNTGGRMEAQRSKAKSRISLKEAK